MNNASVGAYTEFPQISPTTDSITGFVQNHPATELQWDSGTQKLLSIMVCNNDHRSRPFCLEHDSATELMGICVRSI